MEVWKYKSFKIFLFSIVLAILFWMTRALTIPESDMVLSWFHIMASVVRWPFAASFIWSSVQLMPSLTRLCSYHLFSYQPWNEKTLIIRIYIKISVSQWIYYYSWNFIRLFIVSLINSKEMINVPISLKIVIEHNLQVRNSKIKCRLLTICVKEKYKNKKLYIIKSNGNTQVITT